MDLNDKIAARRRELASQAEDAVQAESAKQKVAAIEAAKINKIEKEAIDAEVAKRLAAMGIEQLTPVAPPTTLVDLEVEKALNKAAAARKTTGENVTFWTLMVLGFLGMFAKWWLGLIFFVGALIYNSKKIAAHKEQLVAEGKAKVAANGWADSPAEDHITPVAVTLLAVGGKRIEVIKVIQTATGCSPVDCMNIVDHTPSLVMQGMSAIDAEMLKNKLADAGAKVEMKA